MGTNPLYSAPISPLSFTNGLFSSEYDTFESWWGLSLELLAPRHALHSWVSQTAPVWQSHCFLPRCFLVQFAKIKKLGFSMLGRIEWVYKREVEMASHLGGGLGPEAHDSAGPRTSGSTGPEVLPHSPRRANLGAHLKLIYFGGIGI